MLNNNIELIITTWPSTVNNELFLDGGMQQMYEVTC